MANKKLKKEKVDYVIDLLFEGAGTYKHIAKMARVSTTAVLNIKNNFPLFFGLPRKYEIQRKKRNASRSP